MEDKLTWLPSDFSCFTFLDVWMLFFNNLFQTYLGSRKLVVSLLINYFKDVSNRYQVCIGKHVYKIALKCLKQRGQKAEIVGDISLGKRCASHSNKLQICFLKNG